MFSWQITGVKQPKNGQFVDNGSLIKVYNVLWQVSGFLLSTLFPPPIKITTMIYLKYCLKWILRYMPSPYIPTKKSYPLELCYLLLQFAILISYNIMCIIGTTRKTIGCRRIHGKYRRENR